LRLKQLVQPAFSCHKALGVQALHSYTNKNITIIKDLKDLKDCPKPALTLGLAGLIPFAAAPLYMLNSGFLLPDIVTAQLAYGATILSFLGGVRWGLLAGGGSESWSQYSWSVTPSLLAWVSLLMPDAGAGCAICAGSLALTAYLDLRQTGYPGWLRGLRFILSSGAVLCLLATIYCIINLGTKKQASDYLT